MRDELTHNDAPDAVQQWISSPPPWLVIQKVQQNADDVLKRLHPGEREAILLAEQLNAALVILDDKSAREVAKARALNVAGLVGLIDQAANQGLVDIQEVVTRLQQTTFRVAPKLLRWLLGRH